MKNSTGSIDTTTVLSSNARMWTRQTIARLFALMLISLAGMQTAFAEPASVNINNADALTIAEVLDGVGMRRAEAIVEYRQKNGVFADIYDLANVKGIGDRTIEINEERIRLKD